MKISLYILTDIKIISWRFCILNLINFSVIHPWRLWKVCLQTYRNNRISQKVAYFLRKKQTLGANNSTILRSKKAKFSGCLYEHEHIGRFSNLHYCTFKINKQIQLNYFFCFIWMHSSRLDTFMSCSVCYLFRGFFWKIF